MTRSNIDPVLRTGGAIVTAAVVAIIVVLVVPVPTFALDVLVCINLCVAMLLLLVAMQVPNARSLSAFPTMLLFATLFRLAVNVSSTRLILSQADAGTVIQAFGSFVVSGELVVGAVVFGLITFIQFVVVARGAERVSEVAARFSLDAMPGKQLALDAEVRSGRMSAAAASAAREALENDSQLFGAMDGAMKFVRGDAIAGVFITSVNIVAGLAVGVWSLDMELPQAAHTFITLAIGDGLVTQIPSVLVALAAGVVVTRSRGSQRGVGEEIFGQLTAQPRAIVWTSVLVAVLAAVPGLPAVPFALVAAALAGVAAHQIWRKQRQRTPSSSGDAGILLLIGDELDATRLQRSALELTRRLHDDLGLRVEGTTTRAIAGRRFEAQINGRAIACLDAPTTAHAIDALEQGAQRHAHEVIDHRFVQDLLAATESRSPELVSETVGKRIDVATLTAVMRTLVAEGVPIDRLDRTLEVVADAAATRPGASEVVEAVRLVRATDLMLRNRDSDGALRYVEVDDEVTELLRSSVRASGGNTHVAMSPADRKQLLESLSTAFAGREGLPRVLLAPPSVRPHLRSVIADDLWDVCVLSQAELTAEGVTAMERIGWAQLP